MAYADSVPPFAASRGGESPDCATPPRDPGHHRHQPRPRRTADHTAGAAGPARLSEPAAGPGPGRFRPLARPRVSPWLASPQAAVYGLVRPVRVASRDPSRPSAPARAPVCTQGDRSSTLRALLLNQCHSILSLLCHLHAWPEGAIGHIPRSHQLFSAHRCHQLLRHLAAQAHLLT